MKFNEEKSNVKNEDSLTYEESLKAEIEQWESKLDSFDLLPYERANIHMRIEMLKQEINKLANDKTNGRNK